MPIGVVLMCMLALFGSIRTETAPDESFDVERPKSSMVNDVVVFQTVKEQKGNGYNATTGIFTCTTPGWYFFGVGFEFPVLEPQSSCKLRKNNEDLKTTSAWTSKIGETRTAVANDIVDLVAGDKVYVGGCVGYASIRKDTFEFSGVNNN